MPPSAFAPVIAALAGVVVGGLIAEVRVGLEMRREQRKALNRVLWCQLDLWYDLERYDASALVDLLVSRLAHRLGVDEEQLGLPADQREIMGNIVGEIVKDGRHPESEVQYHHAVEALAFFDPVLAYRLSGKTSLTQHRQQGDAYWTALVERFGSTKAQAEEAQIESIMRPFIQEELLNAARQTLRNDIETVASALSRRTRKRVTQLFGSLKDRIEKDQQELVDAYMDRLIVQISKVAGQLKQAPDHISPDGDTTQ